jgi:hypothetical protein
MPVFETRPNGGNQWFEEFGIAYLLEEAEGRSTDIFVGMLLEGR